MVGKVRCPKCCQMVSAKDAQFLGHCPNPRCEDDDDECKTCAKNMKTCNPDEDYCQGYEEKE